MRRLPMIGLGFIVLLLMIVAKPAYSQSTCEGLFQSDFAEYAFAKRTRLHQVYDQQTLAHDRLRVIYDGEYAQLKADKTVADKLERSKSLKSMHEKLDASYMRMAALHPISGVTELLYELLKWKGEETTPEQIAVTNHLLDQVDVLLERPLQVRSFTQMQRIKNIISVARGNERKVLLQFEPELVALNEQLLYLCGWLLYGDRPTALVRANP